MNTQSILKSKTAIIIAIFCISFLFRYKHITSIGWSDDKSTHFLGMQTENISVFHSSDTFIYERLAKSMISGKGLNLPYHPPMISIILGVIYYFIGLNYFKAKIIFIAISSITSVLTFIIGKELFDNKTGIIAGTLCSLSFGLIMITGALNTETLFSFLMMLSLLSIIITHKSKKSITALISGFVIGITILTRTEFLLSFFFFLLWLLFQKSTDKWASVKKSFFLVLGFSLTILPWAVRNYSYMQEYNKKYPSHELPDFVVLTLNGPVNFAYGNNPTATGGYHLGYLGKEIDHPKKYYLSMNFENPVHKKYILHGYREGINFIINNPKRFIELLGEKFIIFKDFLSYGYGNTNLPAGLNGYRRNIADCFIPSFRLIIPNAILFFAGLLFVSKENLRNEGAFLNKTITFLTSIYALPLIMLITILFVNLGFHGLTRSGVAALPIIFIYQAVFIKRIILDKVKISAPLIAGILFFIIAIAFIETKGMIIIEEIYHKQSIEIELKRKR